LKLNFPFDTMTIGIIVYSDKGNTLTVAKKLKSKLKKAGHDVKLEQIKVVGGFKPETKKFKFEDLPDLDPYDELIFAAWVQAFSLCLPMQQYFEQVHSLKKKKVVLLVTQFFPFPWMGGNRAIGQMTKICKAKGAMVIGAGVVNWAGENRRKKKMKEVVKELSSLF